MKTFPITSAVLSLGLIACGSYEKNEAAYETNATAYPEGDGNYGQGANTSAHYGNSATGTTTWPSGARIVVDNGVTYRVEPGGARIALGPSDSQIVVENGVRYRVDPDGTRVKIDPSGMTIELNTSG